MSPSSQQFNAIVEGGNAWRRGGGKRPVQNLITCVDGFELSVLAGAGAYCAPRPPLFPHLPYSGDALSDVGADYPGPYTAVEVGFPSERPEPWAAWSRYAEGADDPTETVYGYVPVDVVRELIVSHGGERTPEGGAR
ncbi:hypothetical protein [Streptomyces sp. NPDC054784]